MLGRAFTARALLWAVLLLAGVLGAFAVAFVVLVKTPAFAELRRTLMAEILADLIEQPTAIEGEVRLVISDPLKLRISKVRIGSPTVRKDRTSRPVELMELSIPAWPALAGDFDVTEFVMAGGRVDFTGTADDDDSSPGTLARLPTSFLGVRVSDYLKLRDILFRYRDSSGWEFDLTIADFSSQKSEDGTKIVLDGRGSVNGVPYSFAGHFPNPRHGTTGMSKGPFDLDTKISGLDVKFGGSLDVSEPVSKIDAQMTLAAISLAPLLKLMGLDYALDGKGELAAKLTGAVGAMRADAIKLDLKDAQGRSLHVTGSVANMGAGDGLDLAFNVDLSDGDDGKSAAAPVAEIEVTGFKGTIGGSLDQLVIRQIFLFTNLASAELKHVGPITLGRVVRDSDGKIGLLGIRVLEGPKDDPIFDLSGEIRDVLDLKGIKVSGKFNVSLVQAILSLTGPEVDTFGRLKGKLAISDDSGRLRLDAFEADMADTDLAVLSIRMVNGQGQADDPLALKFELDVPNFDAVAAKLGSTADVGALGFSGVLAFPERQTTLRGNAKINQTETAIQAVARLDDGAPLISAHFVSERLYATDLQRGIQVYKVLPGARNESIDIDLKETPVQQTRLDLDLHIDEIDFDGRKASKFRAKGHYQSDVAVLESLRMKYLKGTIEGSARAETAQTPPPVTIKGRIDALDMGAFLKSLDLVPLVTGPLNSTFDIAIEAGDRAVISKSLDGKVEASISGGTFGERVIDLGGQNFERWFFSKEAGKGEATLVCAVIAFDFTDGRGKVGDVVVETNNVQVIGNGTIDLGADTIDLSFNTRPKRHELVDVATPFTIHGKLSKPEVDLASGVIAGRAVGEVLTLPFNVLGLLLPHGQTKPTHRPCVVESAS